MTVAEQTQIFLAMMLCGVCVGAAYDLLGMIRRGGFLTAAADLLLGLVIAAGAIGTGLRLGCDPFRLYALLGIALGWMIYGGSVGTIVRYLTRCRIELSKKVKKRAKSGN